MPKILDYEQRRFLEDEGPRVLHEVRGTGGGARGPPGPLRLEKAGAEAEGEGKAEAGVARGGGRGQAGGRRIKGATAAERVLSEAGREAESVGGFEGAKSAGSRPESEHD